MKAICKAMRRILYIFISLVVLAITFSCTPQKRLSRLVALHPELTTTDTIKINDTVITTELRIDTAFHHSTIKDTVTIEKEKLKLQIVEVRDTIYLEAEVIPDTIVIDKEIPVEKINNTQLENGKNQSLDDLLNRRWFWVVVGVIIACLLIFFYRK